MLTRHKYVNFTCLISKIGDTQCFILRGKVRTIRASLRFKRNTEYSTCCGFESKHITTFTCYLLLEKTRLENTRKSSNFEILGQTRLEPKNYYSPTPRFY